MVTFSDKPCEGTSSLRINPSASHYLQYNLNRKEPAPLFVRFHVQIQSFPADLVNPTVRQMVDRLYRTVGGYTERVFDTSPPETWRDRLHERWYRLGVRFVEPYYVVFADTGAVARIRHGLRKSCRPVRRFLFDHLFTPPPPRFADPDEVVVLGKRYLASFREVSSGDMQFGLIDSKRFDADLDSLESRSDRG